jgi:hypothetical protein
MHKEDHITLCCLCFLSVLAVQYILKMKVCFLLRKAGAFFEEGCCLSTFLFIMKDQLQEFGKLLPEKEFAQQEKLMIALLLFLVMLTFGKLILTALSFTH